MRTSSLDSHRSSSSTTDDAGRAGARAVRRRSVPSAGATGTSSRAQTAERKRRFFAGIKPDDGCRSACASVVEALRATGLRARYEAPVKAARNCSPFSDLPMPRAQALASILSATAPRAQPFTLVLDKVGAFPHERKAAGRLSRSARTGSGVSVPCGGGSRRTYAAAGFEFDRDPVAHVTIARVKDPRRPLPLVDVMPIASPRHRGGRALNRSPNPARDTSSRTRSSPRRRWAPA